jgi:hypothetical protein
MVIQFSGIGQQASQLPFPTIERFRRVGGLGEKTALCQLQLFIISMLSFIEMAEISVSIGPGPDVPNLVCDISCFDE